ncbi:small ribosomal subunit protein uS11-like [Zophobas morio]|uniref:small ribosomal subunit protein uS11-like n=1 Tax=Zophobas morio TaxID=2755281 RepID=UPI0030828312
MLPKQFLATFRKLLTCQTKVMQINETRSFFMGAQRFRDVIDRKEMLRSVPKMDEGSVGEKVLDVDTLIHQKGDIFPDADTPNRLFNGIPFKNLPIVNVRVSPNNTIVSMSDDKGVVKLLRSCGVEGFKNTRKGTNIAAQATAITLGTKVLERGIKTVRVRVRGLGPGRMSAVKGLQMAGLEIVSITDSTPVSWNPPRPRKAKKL